MVNWFRIKIYYKKKGGIYIILKHIIFQHISTYFEYLLDVFFFFVKHTWFFRKTKDAPWKMTPIRPNVSPWTPIWALFIHFCFWARAGPGTALGGRSSWKLRPPSAAITRLVRSKSNSMNTILQKLGPRPARTQKQKKNKNIDTLTIKTIWRN